MTTKLLREASRYDGAARWDIGPIQLYCYGLRDVESWWCQAFCHNGQHIVLNLTRQQAAKLLRQAGY